jgi:hypothetical protein
MTLDRKLFSEDQAVTTTAVSTNQLDFGEGTGHIGDGQAVRLYVQVTEDFAVLTSLKVELQDSADDQTYATVLSGPVVPLAALKAGKVLLEISVPKNMRQYHQLNYVVAGSAATAGKVTAGYIPVP